VSDTALAAGYKAFGDTFLEGLLKEPADAQWRTGGRSSKAWPNGEDKDWWAEQGLMMTKAYYDWRMSNPNLVVWETPQGVPAIELAVSVRLDSGITLKGYIDRVFQDFDSGELLIVDTKSGKTLPTPIQLAFYRTALEYTFGFAPKYGAYWMARKGTLDTVHDLDRFPRNMVERWIRDVQKGIDLRLFSPHVGYNCGMCSVKPSCYAWNDGQFTPDFDSDIHIPVESE
jgi:hypothetical protein